MPRFNWHAGKSLVAYSLLLTDVGDQPWEGGPGLSKEAGWTSQEGKPSKQLLPWPLPQFLLQVPALTVTRMCELNKLCLQLLRIMISYHGTESKLENLLFSRARNPGECAGRMCLHAFLLEKSALIFQLAYIPSAQTLQIRFCICPECPSFECPHQITTNICYVMFAFIT